MAALVCLVAILAIAGVADGAWCVCRSDVADSSLQKALDYACGAGADCTPIIQGGSCYNPNTVRAHCSYAANSYYQRKGQSQQQACDFSGAATLTNTDPSASTCSYPATASGAGTSTSTGTGTGTGTTSTTPGSATPSNLTPTTTTTGGGGMLGGGGGGGLGPSGNSINTDSTDGAHFPRAGMGSLLGIMLTALLVLLIDYC